MAEIWRFEREKKPLLRVAKDGYPRTSSLLAFADAQEVLLDTLAGVRSSLLRGVERPLWGGSDGVDQPLPPSGRGEGDPDDMVIRAVEVEVH